MQVVNQDSDINQENTSGEVDNSGEENDSEDSESSQNDLDESGASDDSNESDESDENESQEEDDSDDEDSDTQDKEQSSKKRKQNGFAKRIARAKKKEADARRDAERSREEVEYWKQKALGSNAQNTEPTPAPAQALEGKPNPDDFETQAEYDDAVIEWKVEQRFKAQEEKQRVNQAQEQQKAVVQKWQDNVASFTKETPDFQDALDAFDEEYDVPIPPILIESLIESDLGPRVLYKLAKDPERALALIEKAKTNPNAAIRELGKIEATLELPKTKTTNTKTKKPAPKPLTPVRGGSGASNKTIYSSDLSQAEFEALRAKQG